VVCIETFCFHHASPLFSLSSFLACIIFSLPKHTELLQATMTSIEHLLFYPILHGTWDYKQKHSVGEGLRVIFLA